MKNLNEIIMFANKYELIEQLRLRRRSA